ncbi:ABC transporter transmembrane domain-containing protein [Tundrisphaera sp. TA3]|uniref:ABC transporter ATP-binding protein n=1 Tax=Tundrisphaera sp. TA3 TaxID=3435775 RepID=UPI003EBF4034
MKNFARLVRFAWPYRVRFGLSLGCAVMVAVFWGGNMGMVYPLLQILIRSQNCQRWVDEKVETSQTEIHALQARLGELDALTRLDLPKDQVRKRYQDAKDAEAAEIKRVRDLRQDLIDIAMNGRADQATAPEQTIGEAQERGLKVAEARVQELDASLPMAKAGRVAELKERRARWSRDLSSATKWHSRYLRAQPLVHQYLPSNGFWTLVLVLGLVMVGVACKGFFLFLQEVLVSDLTQLTLFDIRNQFFRRTMALDLANFSDQGSSELLARFTNDMDSFHGGLVTIMGKVIREPLRVVACLGGALWLNWRLTCLALVLVPVSAACTHRAGKIMKRAVRRSLESMSNIYKILQESVQGIKVVKAYTSERYERRRFFLETKSLYKKSVRVATIDALSDPVLEMLSLVTVSIALLSGSYLVLNQTTFLDLYFFKLQLSAYPMQIEDLLSLYAMLGGISDPVRKLANVHSRVQRASAAADRICALMDRRPEVADKPKAIRLHRHKAAIEFEDVTFGYNGRDPIIKGLNLEVQHGETIALVGPNGCGKSTLMNLLPRFWDVQGGAIRVDGHDLRDVKIRTLRSQIGMVIQETTLFNTTVAENIAYGNRHVGRDAIVAAAKKSYAHQFIMNLPNGYDTILGEMGTGLSGGQRQRLALARAMLRDPSILILDEATSAVDIQDEALIRKAIEEFSRNRTTFVITHSLAGLSFADRIVLMNAGQIEAVGTDAELRRNSPLYRRLHDIHYHRESA